MHAWQVKPGDGAAGLRRIDATRRAVGPTDVVVKIHSAGLNYRDLMFARGDYLGIGTDALIPMADGAGEIIETGRDVTRFKPGDRVINTYFPHWIDGPPTPQKVSGSPGAQFDGVLAEHFVSDEAALVAIPAHLNYDEAATLSCAGITAWNALFADGGLRPGATVVLLGTGGVSIIALQLAHAAGCARSSRRRAMRSSSAPRTRCGRHHQLSRDARMAARRAATHRRAGRIWSSKSAARTRCRARSPRRSWAASCR